MKPPPAKPVPRCRLSEVLARPSSHLSTCNSEFQDAPRCRSSQRRQRRSRLTALRASQLAQSSTKHHHESTTARFTALQTDALAPTIAPIGRACDVPLHGVLYRARPLTRSTDNQFTSRSMPAVRPPARPPACVHTYARESETLPRLSHNETCDKGLLACSIERSIGSLQHNATH